MPKSQIEKLWVGLGLLAAMVLVVIGWFFLIGPQRSDTADVQSSIADAQLHNDGLQSRINALAAESRKMPEYRKELRLAQQALPSTSGLPDFLRSLQALGTSTGTNVQSLTVGTPTDLTSQAPATSTTSSSAPSPAASSTAPAAGALGGSHVYALPITAQISGSTKELGDFLGQLQSVQPRAVLISSITAGDPTAAGQTAGGSSQSTLALTLDAFVAPTDTVEQQQLSQAAAP